MNLTIDGATQRAIASIVSGNYFDVLGIRPLMGRLLSDADDRIRTGHPVVVLSYGFWVERFGMRPDIVGRDLRIGDTRSPSSASPRSASTVWRSAGRSISSCRR